MLKQMRPGLGMSCCLFYLQPFHMVELQPWQEHDLLPSVQVPGSAQAPGSSCACTGTWNALSVDKYNTYIIYIHIVKE